ncbi:transcription elongation factor TFIIS-like [Neltuma alba]|uniref:transcription elongation factor TFIIS-like n=1 Tax=Neltuma alba TaxID=207710 RepID=UPI0010A40F4D|nr:transcription elongation factor TFIIS-like [Prosopis alba]
MEKELIQLFGAVKKAADAAAASTACEVEESQCLDAFKMPKKFPVNYEILVATQVGKHLRVLTKHPRKKIQTFAMDIVEIWKAIIIKGISPKKKVNLEKTHWNGTSNSGKGNTKDSTMEKELIQLYEAVTKAANAAATSATGEVEENRCLDVLKLLKKFPVNYQILTSTQVLKPEKTDGNGTPSSEQADSNGTVSAENVEVEKVGKTRVKRLKLKKTVVDIAKAEKTDRNIEPSTSENVKEKDCNVVTSEKTVSVANIAKNEEKQVSGILKKGSSSSPDSPLKQENMIKTNDEKRDKMREILHEAFSRVSGEADEAIKDQVKTCDPIRVSVAVESMLFRNWGHLNGARKIKYRSLMFNVKDPKNPDFRRRVLVGEYSPERLASMKTAEMASDKRKKENETIKRKALFECERGQKPKATTDQFKCGKCGKRESIFHQMQTRSADEPMTTYVTCVSCNHHWKFC